MQGLRFSSLQWMALPQPTCLKPTPPMMLASYLHHSRSQCELLNSDSDQQSDKKNTTVRLIQNNAARGQVSRARASILGVLPGQQRQ